MDDKLKSQLASHLKDYDSLRAGKVLPSGQPKYIPYGTSGFRGEANEIEHLFHRIGLISALRCLQVQANVGVMITASHNPVQDNGVKLIDPHGEMLNAEWEAIVERFCNLTDSNELLSEIDELVQRFDIDTHKRSGGLVMLASDTRPSSEALVGLVHRGLQAWSSIVDCIDYGHLTTPALHFLVAQSNGTGELRLPVSNYYRFLINGLAKSYSDSVKCTSYTSDNLIVDCANGVGYETMSKLLECDEFVKHLPIKLINRGEGILNKLCGADHVKTSRSPPAGADNCNVRYASLDGDADRLVYFYLEECDAQTSGDDTKHVLKLLDGDKIMALYALYLKDLLNKTGLEQQLTLGIVQTAYANGSSTDYITKELGLKVDCVDTGVKNLHKKALAYDIGIYFEANGHGSVWISDRARMLVESDGPTSIGAIGELRKLFNVINNFTGDAISDILVVEIILRHFDWDVKRWYELYQDRPNSLIKVEVNDRSLVRTTNAGQTCVEPVGFQSTIDELVREFGLGARCFVRPSGTENVVRVYAEAEQQEMSDNLAKIVGERLKDVCDRMTK